MKKRSLTSFQSECGKAHISVETDMPIGLFHDFLMEIKGLMVDRMIQAHKEQNDEMSAQKVVEEKPECDESCSEKEE